MKSNIKTLVAFLLVLLFTGSGTQVQAKTPGTASEPDYLIFQLGTENRDFEGATDERPAAGSNAEQPAASAAGAKPLTCPAAGAAIDLASGDWALRSVCTSSGLNRQTSASAFTAITTGASGPKRTQSLGQLDTTGLAPGDYPVQLEFVVLGQEPVAVQRPFTITGPSSGGVPPSTPQAPAPAQQPGATPGGVPPSLQAKMARLQKLAQKRQDEGGDMEPVVAIADGVQPLIDQQKFSEAEALVDRALELVEKAAPAKQASVEPPKKASASDPTYLVYQFMADSQHPEEASTWVERLQAEFGRQKPGQSKYVGFGFFIEDMNDDVPSLRRKIETLLGIAEKYEMPVFIQLEGTMFWARRSDRLSANPEAVEWSAFPAPGQKTGPILPHIWFNWGHLTAFPVPPPCFESPLFQADVTGRLEKAIAAPLREALKRWQAGTIDRSYLFAGITVGNEVQIPDYREYKMRLERNPGSARPRDQGTGLEMTDAEMVRGGYCSLYNRGYTAERIAEMARARFGGDDAGGKNTEAVTTELLDEVVHDYMAFRAKILADGLAGTGEAQKRIYTHTTSAVGKFMERSRPDVGQWQSRPTVAAAVNPYSRPGFTVVRNRLDLPDLVAQMNAAARGTAAFAGGAWGAVESYATVGQPGRAQSREEYSAYLDELFTSGAKLVSLLEAPQAANNPFTNAAESAGVKSAIKEWLGK